MSVEIWTASVTNRHSRYAYLRVQSDISICAVRCLTSKLRMSAFKTRGFDQCDHASGYVNVLVGWSSSPYFLARGCYVQHTSVACGAFSGFVVGIVLPVVAIIAKLFVAQTIAPYIY